MKRIFIVVLFLLLTLLGCSKSQETFVVTNRYETACNEYSTWFELDVNDFIDILNLVLEDLDYSPLELLDISSEESYQLSENGETWKILISTRENQVREIQLSTFVDTVNDAKKNGMYVEALIELFAPGMKDILCKDLNIYGESKEELPDRRWIYVGNTNFIYDVSNNEFLVFPVEKEYIPEETMKPIQRPQ